MVDFEGKGRNDVSPTKGIDTVLTYIDGQYSGIDVEMM
jgi:hypothetical protein